MIDLAGLAIAGGLYIVPTFAAVQAWAGADRRARVIAAVNVINAAFMVGGTVVVAVLQAFGVTTPMLFVIIGLATLVVAIAIARTMPANPLADFLSILFRAFYRVEVKGLENLQHAGPNPIIALNHVSFLDPPLAMSLLGKDPVFAIDVGISQQWWVKPFLRFTRAMALDPQQADGDPHADQSGEGRRRAGDLPGRPHHRDRQPDEGLRRRRPDRRQGRRHGGAGAARRPGADAVQPAVAQPGAPQVVPQGQGHRAGAGEARRSIPR